MPHAFDLPVLVLTSSTKSGHYTAEALYFPETERVAGKPPIPPLLGTLKAFLPTYPRLDLHRRLPPENFTIRALEIPIPPPKANPAWTEPVQLTLHAVETDDGLYLPHLGLHIPPDADPAGHVRGCLARNGWNTSLGDLLSLAQFTSLSAHREVVPVSLPTLKEQEAQTTPDALLDKLTTALGAKTRKRARGVDHHLDRLAELLAAPEGCRNVLLVGPSGVGKSALVQELARRRRWKMAETSGARLIAGASGFGGWQERCQQLLGEWGRARAIVHLGNLAELFEVGRHRTQPYGMAGFLRGPLLRGEVQATAECTPEQLTYLEKEFPQLLEAFTVMRVEPPSREQLRAIIGPAQAASAAREPSRPEEQVMDLHERFAPHAASPGWEIGWLERSRGRDLLKTFAAQTGLPLVYLDPDLPLDPDQTLQWFQQRLHGQPQAVERLVERLAAFKSALNRPGRPLASLLLLGPTGTGKTELARLLAEHLYGQRTKMTRFDMSEYSDPFAVQQLVGLNGQLILKVRESPFQVLLFDELEKAHPDFFDLLLQLLDEGRLSDAGGNLADFTSTIVLMTTNLGAESLQKSPAGFRQKSTEGGFLDAVRASFRPELLNRIDEVLPFSPLTPEVIRTLAQRELDSARRRRGLASRSLAWTIDPSVLDRLAKDGYDVRYGARPLQRTVERQLLLPLAEQLNQHAEYVPLDIEVGESIVVKPAVTDQQARESARRRDALGHDMTALRQRLVRFGKGPLVVALLNEKALHKKKVPFPMQKWLDGLEALKGRALALEEDTLLVLDRQIEFAEDELRKGLLAARAELEERVLHLFARSFESPEKVTLCLLSDSPHPLCWLGRGYQRLAEDLKWTFRVQTLQVRSGVTRLPTPEDPMPQIERLTREEMNWSTPPSHLVGLLLRFEGPRAAARLCREGGLHRFERGEQHWKLHLTGSPDDLEKFVIPHPIFRKHVVEELLRGDADRTWNLERGQARGQGYQAFIGTDNILSLGPLTEYLLKQAAERAAFAP